jgi:hypothetical protein
LSLLGPNIFLITLCSQTVSLRFSFSVRDQGLHPYKTTGKFLNMAVDEKKFLSVPGI